MNGAANGKVCPPAVNAAHPSPRELTFGAICGSLREHSFCQAIVNTLDELAPDDVLVTALPSVGDFPLYSEDLESRGFPPEVSELADAMSAVDAVVIVSPEYNHSLPGPLKNGLDWISRLSQRPFDGKPVAIQTASPGPFGGVRAQPHLRQVLISLGAAVLGDPEVALTDVASKVDVTTDTLRDGAARRVVASQLAALTRLARTLNGSEVTASPKQGDQA